MKVNADFIFEVLMNEFNNIIGVCAIMGNIQAESSLKSDNLQDIYNTKFNITDDEYTDRIDRNIISKTEFSRDGSGYGLCQWTWYTRKEGLYDYAKKLNTSISDPKMQLEYLIIELKSNYRTLYETLKSTQSLYYATKDFMCIFENPNDKSEKAILKRCSYSETFYTKYCNKENEKEKYYSVQIGAFHKKDNAFNFIERYGSELFKITGLEFKVITDNGWYKIICEVGKIRKEAEDICIKLKRIGYDAFIVYK